MKNVITLGKLIGLLFLFYPPLSILFLKTPKISLCNGNHFSSYVAWLTLLQTDKHLPLSSSKRFISLWMYWHISLDVRAPSPLSMYQLQRTKTKHTVTNNFAILYVAVYNRVDSYTRHQTKQTLAQIEKK